MLVEEAIYTKIIRPQLLKNYISTSLNNVSIAISNEISTN